MDIYDVDSLSDNEMVKYNPDDFYHLIKSTQGFKKFYEFAMEKIKIDQTCSYYDVDDESISNIIHELHSIYRRYTIVKINNMQEKYRNLYYRFLEDKLFKIDERCVYIDKNEITKIVCNINIDDFKTIISSLLTKGERLNLIRIYKNIQDEIKEFSLKYKNNINDPIYN